MEAPSNAGGDCVGLNCCHKVAGLVLKLVFFAFLKEVIGEDLGIETATTTNIGTNKPKTNNKETKVENCANIFFNGLYIYIYIYHVSIYTSLSKIKD
jgi:hypothetical protein